MCMMHRKPTSWLLDLETCCGMWNGFQEAGGGGSWGGAVACSLTTLCRFCPTLTMPGMYQGLGKPTDISGSRPFMVAFYWGGLCLAVGHFRLMVMMMLMLSQVDTVMSKDWEFKEMWMHKLFAVVKVIELKEFRIRFTHFHNTYMYITNHTWDSI